MFFVIDNARLRQWIKMTREDRRRFRRPDKTSPFYRIEANADFVTLCGRGNEANLAATVYEPGVLFLRIDRVAKLLETMVDEPTLAIQVNREGLHLANVKIGLEFDEMLLYVDATRAPLRHPDDTLGPLPKFDGQNGPASWGELFELIRLRPNPLDHSRMRRQRHDSRTTLSVAS